MAVPSNPNQDLALQYRIVLANAYGFVQGQQSVQSFSALTFEQLAAAQVDRLTGKGSPGRPNALQRVQKVVNDLTSMAGQIKATDPSAFLAPDGDKDVNTAP